MPTCQLLVQDASQDCGQQEDRPAHRWVVRGDQGVGHEGYTTFGCGYVTYGRKKYMRNLNVYVEILKLENKKIQEAKK